MSVRKPSGARLVLAFVAITLLVPAIIGINALIYHARFAYAHLHPQEVAAKPHTISRALADPRIGDPFGHCLFVLSPMLGLGVSILVWLAISSLPRNLLRQRRYALGFGLSLIMLQTAACAGMMVLAAYSLEENRDLHMGASYVFFITQMLVILIAGVGCQFMRAIQASTPVFRPQVVRIAARLAIVPVSLAFAFFALFFAKDWVPQALWMPVMHIYTRSEPLMITSFLLYLGFFVFEAAYFLHRSIDLPRVFHKSVVAIDD
jgi:hypothetical protein